MGWIGPVEGHRLDRITQAPDVRPSIHAANHSRTPPLPPPQEYSEIYREAGAAAIAVNVDPLTGGCAHKDIQDMAREQEDAISNDVAGR